MRRVRKSRSRREWSDAHQLQLESGFDWFDEAWSDHPSAAALKEMRQAWSDCRESLLAKYFDQLPCTRPWAWWKFSAPSPRDEAIPEREQLSRLGVLSADEIERFEQLEQMKRIRSARSGFDA